MSCGCASLGQADPFKLFESRLNELRQGKAEEAAGRRPPTPLSKVPWWCWDHPGFKDCHALAFRAAQADCVAQGQADVGACIVPLADHYAQACPCPKDSPISMTTVLLLGGIALVAIFAITAQKEAP